MLDGINTTKLSKCGKAMLIYSILCNEKKNLKFLGKSDENIELIGTQITEFKKHGISVDNLKEKIDTVNDRYLRSKMEDMFIVYEKFQDNIKDKYIDENDVLTILSGLIEESNIFNDAIFYIDEFVGYTKQEYDIIEKLLKIGKEVNINVCTDSLEIIASPETDIFYSNKQTARRLIDLAEDNNIEVEKSICIDKSENRFKTQELKYIEKNIYNIHAKKYDKKIENISLCLANNQYSEIEYVASEIIKIVRDGKVRYKDISVITKNLDVYSNLCKVIFEKYGIPAFIDEKKDLSDNILVKYILALLDIYAKNWSHEAMFNYLKSGFVNIDKADIYELENYCLRWGIKKNKWYLADWEYFDEKEDSEENIKNKLLKMNMLRNKIVYPLLKLKENLAQSMDAEGITKCIYDYIIENAIDKKLEEKIKSNIEMGNNEIAAEYKMSFDILLNVFDEIVLVFKNDKMTFDKYAQILKIGLGNSGLGKIPTACDEVVIGDVDRSRSHKVKVVFIIGLNDGMFPSINRNEGYFNDKDREFFKQEGMELAKGTIENLYEENFNIYKVFTTAEEKIYMSYASSDSEGRSLRPSIIVSKIRKLFPDLEEKSDVIEQHVEISNENIAFEELLNSLSKLKDGEEIEIYWYSCFMYFYNNVNWHEKLINSLKGIFYTNEPKDISNDSVNKLYGSVLNTSVSRLEQYRACPFSYYLKYGLKLSEKNTLKIKSVDTGSFMHDVIDSFFNEVKRTKYGYKRNNG